MELEEIEVDGVENKAIATQKRARLGGYDTAEPWRRTSLGYVVVLEGLETEGNLVSSVDDRMSATQELTVLGRTVVLDSMRPEERAACSSADRMSATQELMVLGRTVVLKNMRTEERGARSSADRTSAVQE